jgi:hypothetical protein
LDWLLQSQEAVVVIEWYVIQIWGSHSSDFEDFHRLGGYAV